MRLRLFLALALGWSPIAAAQTGPTFIAVQTPSVRTFVSGPAHVTVLAGTTGVIMGNPTPGIVQVCWDAGIDATTHTTLAGFCEGRVSVSAIRFVGCSGCAPLPDASGPTP
jgi:hypothetical protein